MNNMNLPAILTAKRAAISTILLDLSALAFIYMVPALSHLLSLPVYLAEPMRLMLILSLAHSGRGNAYLLALTLPAFSLVISAHPVLPKMLLITTELTLNAFLFFLLAGKMKHLFFPAFLSILVSKAVYYLLKYIFIRLAVIDTDLVTTPLLFQLVMTLLFSLYLATSLKNPDPPGKAVH